MSATLEVPIPAGLTDDEVRDLHESVAVYLFERGFLSTREAAQWLQVDYEAFRDMAARRGASTLRYDPAQARREMARLGIPLP